jgi:hypothetical protein
LQFPKNLKIERCVLWTDGLEEDILKKSFQNSKISIENLVDQSNNFADHFSNRQKNSQIDFFH